MAAVSMVVVTHTSSHPSRIFSVQVIRFDGPIVTGYNYLASRTSPFHERTRTRRIATCVLLRARANDVHARARVCACVLERVRV